MIIKYLPPDQDVIKTIAEWVFKEWGHLNSGSSLERSTEKLHQRTESTEIPITLVAFDQDIPIGTASLVVNDMETHPQYTPWLANVYVVPEFRKNGVGSALCKAIAAEMKRLRIEKAFLFTPNNEAMYRRLGWQTIERVSYHGEEVVVMSLKCPHDSRYPNTHHPATSAF
jgi:N-acetylglutamate synthase-like GNAT family acetyltransferase